MAVTAPVLETRHVDAPAKKPTPAQTTAAVQTTKPGPVSSHDNDDSLSESAPGNGKPDAKAKPAGAKGSAKPTAAAAGSGPKAASGKQVVASDAQKSGGISPQQKWFDQLTTGAVSLVKLQRLAQANPELLNAKDKSGRTAIFYAVTRGKSDVVDWLMAHEGHRLEGSTKPFLNVLFNAVAAGSPEIVKALDAFVRHASKGRYIREPADLETFSVAWIKKQPWLTPHLEAAGLNVRPSPNASPEAAVRPNSRPAGKRSGRKVSHAAGMPPSQLNLSVLAGPQAVREHLSAFHTRDPESLKGGGFALLKALQVGRDKEARILIEHWNGEFIDQPLLDTLGNPLTIAVAKSSVEVLNLLVKHRNGKLLGKEYIWGACCLVEALRLGKVDAARILLDAMDDERVALSRVGGYNALAIAAYEGHEKIVPLLLNRAPAMAKEKNSDGKTPLDIARERNHGGIVELLMRHAERPEPARATPIVKSPPASAAQIENIDMRLLIISGNLQALRARLAEQQNPDAAMLKDCADSLTLALTFGKTEIATALIAYQAGAVLDDICARPIHPLLIARNLNKDVLRLLLNHQNGKLLDPDASGNNALQKTILAEQSESAVVLIKEMDDARLAWANPRGENALTLAVMNGNVEGNEEIARLLFARLPALAKQADADGRTPLDHAILGKHAALIKLFASQ